MAKPNRKPMVYAVAESVGIACALAVCGCAPAAPPDTRAADEAAVRKADADWVKAAQTRQVDAWVAFYAEDAVVLPPNDKLANSKDGIRKAVGDLLGLPGYRLAGNLRRSRWRVRATSPMRTALMT